MHKINAWLVVVLGLLLLIPAFGVAFPDWVFAWVVPIVILAIGIIKLIIEYKK